MVHQAAVGTPPDRLAVRFDDEHAVASAGIVLPAALALRLGVAEIIEECVDLGDQGGAVNPGAKVMTLVHGMLLGADCIDDCDVLRAGRTGAVLGHAVLAPSTLGTFLRAFTFGHVRQLDRALGQALTRAWAAGAGPGTERLVIDVDSFVGEVHGHAKQGASFGYTRVRGYHPLLATRADTGEVLHIRCRKGSANTSRGMHRFTDELIARVNRAGAEGPKLLRADSGFWSAKTFSRLDRAGWQFSIGVRMQKHVRAAVEAIDERAWTVLDDYPPTSIAQIAETTLGGRRLIIRRVRTLDRQGELLPSWEHYPFATNRQDALGLVEAEHRKHAVVEQAIRDLKDQALAHFPSGKFTANAAWTVIAALAHNLLRWTQRIGLPGQTVRAARTLRRRLLSMPCRMTRTARTWTLQQRAELPALLRAKLRHAALTGADYANLLRVPDRRTQMGKRDYALLRVLGDLGLRSAELRGIRMGDVRRPRANAQHQMLLVRGKGGRDREVPIPAETEQAINAWLSVHPLARGRGLRDEELVFVRLGRHRGTQEPGMLSAQSVGKLVSNAGAAAGVPERLAHPHALRSYWATSLLEDGVPVHVVQHRLGHADLRTTSRYAASRPEHAEDLVDVLDRRHQDARRRRG